MSYSVDYACITSLISTEPNVTIQISYNRPSDFTQLSPPYYHPASSITLICNAYGASEIIRYYWTSTCTSCSTRIYTTQRVDIDFLTSAHAGTYTCTVTDSGGRTANSSAEIKVKGLSSQIFC